VVYYYIVVVYYYIIVVYYYIVVVYYYIVVVYYYIVVVYYYIVVVYYYVVVVYYSVVVVCNVEQVRILRGEHAIQAGVNRCKLISSQEFDILFEDCTSSRFAATIRFLSTRS